MPKHKYPLLIDVYRKQLEGRFERKEIKKITMETHLRDTNRILESVIKVLPSRIIEATIKEAGFGSRKVSGSYLRVIRDLKAIIDKRER